VQVSVRIAKAAPMMTHNIGSPRRVQNSRAADNLFPNRGALAVALITVVAVMMLMRVRAFARGFVVVGAHGADVTRRCLRSTP
jgi:hypothetical protein